MSILFWSLRQVERATAKLPPEPSWVEFPPETNFIPIQTHVLLNTLMMYSMTLMKF